MRIGADGSAVTASIIPTSVTLYERDNEASPGITLTAKDSDGAVVYVYFTTEQAKLLGLSVTKENAMIFRG